MSDKWRSTQMIDEKANVRLLPRSIRSRLKGLVSAFLVVAMVIALSVGLSVGLKKNQPAPIGTDTLNSTLPLTPSTNFTRGVLSNTSLSTVTTFGTSRDVFFQDINGTLRHATFSSKNGWRSNVDYLLPAAPIPPPRLGTPIATTYPATTSNLILVFYANVNNSLSAISYDIDSSSVIGTDVFNGSITIAPNSRCLSSAAAWTNATQPVVFSVVLFESVQGNIFLLYGKNTLGSVWEWQDMTSALDAFPWRRPGEDAASLACPCTINSIALPQTTSSTSSISSYAIQATFFNPQFLSNTSSSPIISFYVENATQPGLSIA